MPQILVECRRVECFMKTEAPVLHKRWSHTILEMDSIFVMFKKGSKIVFQANGISFFLRFVLWPASGH